MKLINVLFFYSFIFQLVAQDLSSFVNPMIGTAAYGHTFPGPSMPFGMVQLSPDTRLEGWDGCSAYHHSDQKIYGFSHTHLSGTGCSDYGDILLMPCAEAIDIQSKEYPYASEFNKENEKVKLGQYSVLLNKANIQVRLTSTLRTGLHEYTFMPGAQTSVIIDLSHRDKVVRAGFGEVIKDGVSGYRISNAWAKEQHVYFALKTSAPIVRHELSSDSLRMILFFDFPTSKKILIQCAISAVDERGAQSNLQAEWQGFNFEKAYKENIQEWNKMLSRIKIETKDNKKKTIFYTALYHTLLSPNLFQDSDARYRGMDLKIHKGDPLLPRYTVFSLWDTYRAAHPLYQLVYPDFNRKFVMTFLGQYKENKRLPVWELAGNETYCMIGNHSIPVIADALLQSPESYSPQEKKELIEAIEATLFQNNFCQQQEFRNGYISTTQAGESVSKTIENSLDYAAYEKLIEKFGNKDQRDTLIYYSSYYKNLFNEKSGFFQAKSNNIFTNPFNPREVNHHYTEANAYQYLFGAHHDIPGMIECMSRGFEALYHKNPFMDRRIKLELRLDSIFYTSSSMTGREQADITGTIGQYAHGNEPSHHYAYLYNYSGKTYKAQKILNKIMTELYTDQNDGLCGNEDCGQMSAWYVFSSLGFYPVVPFGGMMDTGVPQFNSVQILVPNKAPITIQTDRKNGDTYVASFLHNAKANQIRFPLKYGDKLIYNMSMKPGMNIFEDDIHKWLIEETDFMPLPYILEGESIFGESTNVVLKSSIPNSEIHYTLQDNPTTYQKYEDPIIVDHNTTLRFRSCRMLEGEKECTPWLISNFRQRPQGISLQSITECAPQYTAGGRLALIDGQNGSVDFHDGMWQGTQGENIEVIIYLDENWNKKINSIQLTALQDSRSWVILPEQVEFLLSNDGEQFQSAAIVTHQIDKMDEKKQIHKFELLSPNKFNYLKLKIKNPGLLPSEHIGASGKSWIFLDEIKINTED